ncbi:MAG TPA: TetR/AcrR family transcriptional regulator [Candidatus Acidoferrales bacterium]|nr:TetR/AcrR family transcriptional regulator [Candidatus Acidoferrales bacterium]
MLGPMPEIIPSHHSRPRPGGRSARVVSTVLAATLDILIDRGYRGFSISEVAQRSGVHETSIYRRWQTKARLVSEAIIRFAARSSPPDDTGSFRGDLYALLRTVVTRLHTPLGEAIGQLVASQDPDIATLRREYWNSRLETVRELVIRAQARGEVPASLDPRFVLEMLSGPMLLRAISGEMVTPRYVRKLVDRVVPVLSIRNPSR